jgi:hypothetical protein
VVVHFAGMRGAISSRAPPQLLHVEVGIVCSQLRSQTATHERGPSGRLLGSANVQASQESVLGLNSAQYVRCGCVVPQQGWLPWLAWC